MVSASVNQQSAVCTLSPLTAKQDRGPARHQRVIAQPGGPVDQVLVIGAGVAGHLHMTLDGNVRVDSEPQTIRSSEL
jgi:hypothetical protein